FTAALQQLNGHGVTVKDYINYTDEEGGLYFEPLYEILADGQRFSEISTIIVCLAKPELGGLGFCEKTHDLLVNKILITTEDLQGIAIEAFNNKIIDYLIIQDKSIELNHLDAYIQQAHSQYFATITRKFARENDSHIYSYDEYQHIKNQFFIEYNL